MQEHPEQGGIEQRVEDPRADAAAPAADGAEVHPHHAHVARQVAPEQRELAGERDGGAPGGARGGEAGAHPEPEPERDGVRQRRRQDGQHLERLRELQPQERHGHGGGVREHPGRGAPPALEHREHAPRRVEVPGEVVGVGPEEDAARGAGPRREAQEPPERRGPAPAAPRPPRVPYLRDGGEQGAGEDGRRHGRHEERVRGRHGAERERLPAAQGGPEEGVEGEAERDVGGEEAEEERPGGEPQVGGAPPEADDGRVLGEPVRGGGGHGRRIAPLPGRRGGGGGGCACSVWRMERDLGRRRLDIYSRPPLPEVGWFLRSASASLCRSSLIFYLESWYFYSVSIFSF
ncbi:hypothetical protein GQ55_3G484100 [Panicum hallii var. hallii]|uniref:Uncharacterized protein n=1 Tax=Panicum hallii var. hallii TaxID=1504633 RepID=A0A2T7EJN0_9POAL|nr:hypothetical protein GQ55_3G484100 [Panicum hallii var. hallii]